MRHLHTRRRKDALTAGAGRYEVCQLVRGRGGARTLRVLATADSEDGAHEVVRTISDERGEDVGPFAIYDTATRLWLTRDPSRRAA